MVFDPVAAVLEQFSFPVSCALFSFESSSAPESCKLLGTWGDQDKVYPWMSVTKLVTSRTILGAVENGVLDLEQPLEQLPGVSEPRPVSVADLLAHRAGLDHEKREFTRDPHSRRVYSNSGYEILGDLLSEHSGVPFATWVVEMVFSPLGIKRELRGSPAWDMHGSLRELLAFAFEAACPRFLCPRLFSAWSGSDGMQLPGVVPGYGFYRDNAWGLGCEVRADKDPHWTLPGSSAQTYGHFGQSGSFLWIDPTSRLGAVFLGQEAFGALHKQLWPKLNCALREVAKTA
ncbi:serine hydrolase domain-containing protein [Varibaculum cambriense]|uniref:serine hydrolase domain-containing protein n=2 Tax=Varibaculum TaxID=184869 RepID=UPI000C7D7246|nr:serine hydrolase domain-containing protein [Varibaculum cambriense]WIK89025.1 serine hydrolase domain-containing protein [Varibaculum cambriense]